MIIDNVGNHSLRAYRRVLSPDGIVVLVTGPKDNLWLGPLGRVLGATLLSPFVNQTHAALVAELNPQDLAVLSDLLAAGTIRSVIDRRYPLAEVPAALASLEQGRTRGKNVILAE